MYILGSRAKCSSALCIAVCFLLLGCSGRPSRVQSPSWDPPTITSSALGQLDTNGDSAIDLDESRAAPGLFAGFSRIDRNSDKRLSAEEIESRFQLYRERRTGLVSRSYQVTLDRKPLYNARIEFVPEEFVGGVIGKAEGVTDYGGNVVPYTVGQELPAMQVGYYRVVAYRDQAPGSEPITLKELPGVEVSPKTEVDEDRMLTIRLSTK